MTSTSIILSYRLCEYEIAIVVAIIVVDCSHLRRYASELGQNIFNLDAILKVFSRNYLFRLCIKNDTSRLVTLKRDLKYLELRVYVIYFFSLLYIHYNISWFKTEANWDGYEKIKYYYIIITSYKPSIFIMYNVIPIIST